MSLRLAMMITHHRYLLGVTAGNTRQGRVDNFFVQIHEILRDFVYKSSQILCVKPTRFSEEIQPDLIIKSGHSRRRSRDGTPPDFRQGRREAPLPFIEEFRFSLSSVQVSVDRFHHDSL